MNHGNLKNKLRFRSRLCKEEGPGIEQFQIVGEATPGKKLLGCGYPLGGAHLCMFQWVRHLQDGTKHYIKGAIEPEYVVTADDVGKLISVECIPMDDQGHMIRKCRARLTCTCPKAKHHSVFYYWFLLLRIRGR